MSTISIHIKSSGDKKYEVEVDTSSTIEDLKAIIAAQADVPPERQRLIYSGKVLKDHETVAFYKIQSGHTVHLVKGAAPKSASPPAEASAAPSASSSGDSSVPSNIATGTGLFNPLADLTGARYAGYTQLPSASMFGPDGGVGLFLTPDLVSSMILSPGFQEQLNAMLLNPQMLDFMIQQNPQLRAMGPQARAMLQLPMFRQMMSNPEMLRSMMSMTGGAGGAGGAGASFPAPGENPTVGGAATSETGASGTGSTGSGDSGSPGSSGAANPFAALFPGGMPPIDPAMFGGAAAPAPQDNRPPEERYESQLRQLNDMGFFDFDRNVAALRRSGGSVQGAIEVLLSGI